MTLDEFRVSYSNVLADDIKVQSYLDLFSCMYTDDYGCMSDYLQGLFVAHRCYMSELSASPVMLHTSKRVGDVSIGGQMVRGGDSGFMDYSASRYGVEFSTMIAPFGAGAMMASEFHGG